jgi:hypothetical protein
MRNASGSYVTKIVARLREGGLRRAVIHNSPIHVLVQAFEHDLP